MQYVSTEEILSDTLPDLNADDDDVVERITRLAEEVSSIVDRFCDRPDGYFAALETDSTATVKHYRGRDQDFLQIGRHVPGNVTVQGIASTAFYEHEVNGWLYVVPLGGSNVTNDEYLPDYRAGRFWDSSIRYAVSARWGFDATPPDIKQAVKQIVEHIFDRGEGVLGQVTPTGFVIERDLPPTAKTILEKWQKREFEVV